MATTMIETFVWDHHFVTGLAGVDAQHHELVRLFNELSASLFGAGDELAAPQEAQEETLQGIFERLVDYTEHHFRDEEALMKSAGLDERHVRMHESMHRQFVQQVHQMWGQRVHMRRPGQTVIGFLTAWLGLHILGIDQSMARQIHSIEHGCTAEQAFEREAAHHDNGTQALLKMIGRLYHVLSVQNGELVRANAYLEERVAQRTKELERANAELHAANARLEAFSRTDGLLQIANRSYFDDRLAYACAVGMRRQSPVGLLLIDVDHFKKYNDHYGHQAGDVCLQQIAQAVGRAVHRTTDLVARYGGEELAVVLPDTESCGVEAVALRVIEQVAALRMEHRASPTAPFVTVSVGGAAMVPGSLPWDASATLIANADAALYRAKSAGRNCVMLTGREGLSWVAPAATPVSCAPAPTPEALGMVS